MLGFLPEILKLLIRNFSRTKKNMGREKRTIQQVRDQAIYICDKKQTEAENPN